MGLDGCERVKLECSPVPVCPPGIEANGLWCQHFHTIIIAITAPVRWISTLPARELIPFSRHHPRNGKERSRECGRAVCIAGKWNRMPCSERRDRVFPGGFRREPAETFSRSLCSSQTGGDEMRLEVSRGSSPNFPGSGRLIVRHGTRCLSPPMASPASSSARLLRARAPRRRR